MIAEPGNELYAAVKAIANPWPPDNEESAQQLGAAWKTVGDAATQASTQFSTLQQQLAQLWRDQAGATLGSKLSGSAMSLQQIGQSSAQIAGSATQYGQALDEVKTAITKTIAANLPTFLQLGNPQFGAAGAAQQQAMVAQIAAALKAMVDAKTAELAGTPPPPPPAAPDEDTTLGHVGDVAGAVSAVAGLAALIPVLTPVAAPIAALSGGVALVAHGIDAAVNHPDEPMAWAGVGGDALGLIPGVNAVGGVVKGVQEAATTLDAVKGAADVGLQVPTIIADVNPSPDASLDKDSAGLGSLASNVVGAVKAVR